jgi:hypothetical protein
LALLLREYICLAKETLRWKSPKACAVLKVGLAETRPGLAASSGPLLRRWLGVQVTKKKRSSGPTTNIVDGLLTEHE